MKIEYIKPVIETIVLFNQPMLAGHSNDTPDAKKGTTFSDEDENDAEDVKDNSVWK
jgi:hypothetical protein